MSKRLLPLALLGFSIAHAAPSLETVVEGLKTPWAVAFLPDGQLLVTERDGTMRTAKPGAKPSAPIQGVPAVDAVGQGGLLDVITDSDFARNRTIYFCYAEPAADKTNTTVLASAKLSADNRRLTDAKVIFSQKPRMESKLHFGCRIVEAPDGKLFLSLGERYKGMAQAQTLDNHFGKIVRVGKDGSVPADNPFVATAGALPEIWSLGHRNSQGLTLDAKGQLWEHEHGPQGGDELNLIRPKLNYGWPVITYGENYGGGKIGDGIAAKAGMEQPNVKWVPSIAPAGLVNLKSAKYGAAWQGSFFIGSLKFGHLERVKLGADNRVVEQEKLFPDTGRMRDVREGPDGLLYLVLEGDGKILRVKP
ncbi:PQQ-dependent sugar dehydrogenase [Roseateles asaccharophilus]|uniref:Glucose/arabinose dehydrogenase n=1 Tax=Roseateles asaccharophilus TaxID=582607 RepID=A0ABU2AHB4_9BURK|nr:PQQ-dependent sugar dehydrogenase [Roseateles asaccharophilus]MDR7335373.1 glucose/arabinose dehydrogenase [Roseateles asaccharophilus]